MKIKIITIFLLFTMGCGEKEEPKKFENKICKGENLTPEQCNCVEDKVFKEGPENISNNPKLIDEIVDTCLEIKDN